LDTQHSSFDLARLDALKAYSALEYEIFLLFHFLMGAKIEVTAAVFYQIISTRTRYAIVGSLMDIDHRETWKRSWGKIERWLGMCDTARNHIIHWSPTVMHKITVDLGRGVTTGAEEIQRLKNSARLYRSSQNERVYTEADIKAERDGFRVMMHIVNRLALCVRHPDRWPWSDIYRQPVGDRSSVEFLQLLNELGHPARLPPYET
jgi:hypothetical protein